MPTTFLLDKQGAISKVYRGKLDKPAPDSVAEHDLVSEVYHVLDGSATFVTGGTAVDAWPTSSSSFLDARERAGAQKRRER